MDASNIPGSEGTALSRLAGGSERGRGFYGTAELGKEPLRGKTGTKRSKAEAGKMKKQIFFAGMGIRENCSGIIAAGNQGTACSSWLEFHLDGSASLPFQVFCCGIGASGGANPWKSCSCRGQINPRSFTQPGNPQSIHGESRGVPAHGMRRSRRSLPTQSIP